MSNQGICVLGSLNVDLTVSLPRFHQPGETITGTDFHTFLGGKGGNQAVAAAKLGGSVCMFFNCALVRLFHGSNDIIICCINVIICSK